MAAHAASSQSLACFLLRFDTTVPCTMFLQGGAEVGGKAVEMASGAANEGNTSAPADGSGQEPFAVSRG